MTGQVRLDIYPDGGMARLRVFGQPTAAARTEMAERFLRLLPGPQLGALLQAAGLTPAEAARHAEAPAGSFDLNDFPPSARELFRIQLST